MHINRIDTAVARPRKDVATSALDCEEQAIVKLSKYLCI